MMIKNSLLQHTDIAICEKEAQVTQLVKRVKNVSYTTGSEINTYVKNEFKKTKNLQDKTYNKK